MSEINGKLLAMAPGNISSESGWFVTVVIIIIIIIIIIIGIQPLGWSGQRPEFSQETGMALVRCILGKFLGVACNCFPPTVVISDNNR